jgi:hypothetical protein
MWEEWVLYMFQLTECGRRPKEKTGDTFDPNPMPNLCCLGTVTN